MEPQTQTGLSSHPHFPPSHQPRTLQMEKCLLVQGGTQSGHSRSDLLCFDSSPHLHLSSSPGTWWDHSVQDAPGARKRKFWSGGGPGRGNTAFGTGVSPALDKQKALLRLARAALHPAGGAPPAPGANSDVKTYLPGAPCLSNLPRCRLD